MATGYHLNVGVVSRGQGQSVIAKAAYNAREKLTEERTGETKDYTRKQDRAVWSGLFVDKAAPAWAHDREQLWNAADAFEKRKDAQIAYNIITALPHELTDRQREFIVKDFAREQFLRRGAVADVHIHEPSAEGDDRNHHVHMLVSMREMTPEGFGKRRVLTWEDKEQNLARWREQWAERCARELEKAGYTQEAERWREGHRTLEQQSRAALERGDAAYAETLKGRQATKHRGAAVDAMERRGLETERGTDHRQSVERTATLAELRAELRGVDKQIAVAEIQTVINASPDRRQFTAAFNEALAERGMMLAAVTKEEAERSHREASFARAVGNTAPRYRAGEIVIVTEPRLEYRRAGQVIEPRRVFRLHERMDPQQSAQFMALLDRPQLQGIEATKQTLDTRAAQRRDAIAAARLEKATTINPRARTTAVNDNLRRMGAIAGRGFSAAVKIAEKTISAVADAFASLFAPPTPKGPAQIEDEQRRAASAANDHDLAAEEHSRLTEHEHTKARHHEEARREAVAREQYERLERERGGRQR